MCYRGLWHKLKALQQLLNEDDGNKDDEEEKEDKKEDKKGDKKERIKLNLYRLVIFLTTWIAHC